MRAYCNREKTKPRVFFDDQSIAPGFSGYVFSLAYSQGTLFTDEFRTWLFNAQDGKCGYCGESLGETWKNNKSAHVEHVQNKREGGSDLPPNLMYSCRSCNSQKGAWHYTALLIKIPMRRAGITGILKSTKAKILIDMGLLAITPLEKFHFEICGWPHVKPEHNKGNTQ